VYRVFKEYLANRVLGVRIDSGDLAFLSRKARQMLDQEKLDYVKIVASNDLDEYVISDILNQGGKIDIWGVGTNLVADKRNKGRLRETAVLQLLICASYVNFLHPV
jgi:nicotinic acid phosphoribosyltransferase